MCVIFIEIRVTFQTRTRFTDVATHFPLILAEDCQGCKDFEYTGLAVKATEFVSCLILQVI